MVDEPLANSISTLPIYVVSLMIGPKANVVVISDRPTDAVVINVFLDHRGTRDE